MTAPVLKLITFFLEASKLNPYTEDNFGPNKYLFGKASHPASLIVIFQHQHVINLKNDDQIKNEMKWKVPYQKKKYCLPSWKVSKNSNLI